MDIRATLLEEHSKIQMLKIVKYIGDRQDRFDELFNLMLTGEYRVIQRAAWAVHHAAEAQPQLTKPHLKTMVKNLADTKLLDAVKRNTLRILAAIDLPKSLQGIMAEHGFRMLDDPKEPVAVRMFAMTVLYNICQEEPELAPELIAMLEDHLPHGSAGLKARGKKILVELRKMSAG